MHVGERQKVLNRDRDMEEAAPSHVESRAQMTKQLSSSSVQASDTKTCQPDVAGALDSKVPVGGRAVIPSLRVLGDPTTPLPLPRLGAHLSSTDVPFALVVYGSSQAASGPDSVANVAPSTSTPSFVLSEEAAACGDDSLPRRIWSAIKQADPMLRKFAQNTPVHIPGDCVQSPHKRDGVTGEASQAMVLAGNDRCTGSFGASDSGCGGSMHGRMTSDQISGLPGSGTGSRGRHAGTGVRGGRGTVDSLMAVAEALSARSDQNLLKSSGNLSELRQAAAVPEARLAHIELKLSVKSRAISGRRHGGNGLAVGAQLEATSPQLLREQAAVGATGRRRAPVILLESKDRYLEQGISAFFNLYADLHKAGAPDHERPSLLIFVDLSSDSMHPEKQMELVKRIESRLKEIEASGNPAYREAARRVYFNDPTACIQGLTLSSSNDLVLSTVRKSTVCGLSFLRCLTGRDVLKMYRLKTGSVQCGHEAEESTESALFVSEGRQKCTELEMASGATACEFVEENETGAS